ncbi:glycerophosphodiester phosphodiesterase [Anaerofustis stercorihominis]|uniref:Glycerophosphodiester phosphodiesterase family protein n=1 Tax=Anaerofustis stercorihominis DSM 17244 TaxID=445971 RepID=B1CC42_9FIRM|nr:glycerophosphodiester phosphodiesterase [Anaerofustis stercorihominis]EDS71839.1 glycerophosphodiester phosphodiesterase family protein [Anaerofustis stercorihominis DSM 17244]MCQ4796107.1 glycerophosphodiester phosphodiesterase [Anaerofustis stercorihominis]
MSKICAHRGMLKQKTENTISSFKEAMKYDIDSIELDVHLTKDNKLVVFHDFTLERMCDINEYIGELTYDEIKKIKINNEDNIPLFEEVLDLFTDTDINLNVELKSSSYLYNDIEHKTVNMIKDYNMEDYTIFSSFDHRALKNIKEIDKTLKVGALYEGFFENIINYAKENSFDAIHPQFLCIDENIMDKARECNIEVNCYTINTLREYNYIKNLNVDTIITNIADEILKRGE